MVCFPHNEKPSKDVGKAKSNSKLVSDEIELAGSSELLGLSKLPSRVLHSKEISQPGQQEKELEKVTGITQYEYLLNREPPTGDNLLRKPVFLMLLNNEEFCNRYFNFLENESGEESLLFLKEVKLYQSFFENDNEYSNITADILENRVMLIQDTYVKVDGDLALNIAVNSEKKIEKRLLQSALEKNDTTNSVLYNIFDELKEEIENSLFNDSYHRFITTELSKLSQVGLINGEVRRKNNLQGLGDCFTLSDPNKKELPLIYASDSFVKLTGFEYEDVMNVNCRFLQRPEYTDKKCVQNIRDRLESKTDLMELLLNFRKNGEPFWNLLFLTHVKDINNKIIFILGAQVDVSINVQTLPDKVNYGAFDDYDDSDLTDEADHPSSYFNEPSIFLGDFFYNDCSLDQNKSSLPDLVCNNPLKVSSRKSLSDNDLGAQSLSNLNKKQPSISSLASLVNRAKKNKKKRVSDSVITHVADEKLTLHQQNQILIKAYSKYIVIQRLESSKTEKEGGIEYKIVSISYEGTKEILNSSYYNSITIDRNKNRENENNRENNNNNDNKKLSWYDLIGTDDFLSFKKHIGKDTDIHDSATIKNKLESGKSFKMKVTVPLMGELYDQEYRKKCLEDDPLLLRPPIAHYSGVISLTGLKNAENNKPDFYIGIMLPTKNKKTN